jgi:hypothetical protein
MTLSNTNGDRKRLRRLSGAKTGDQMKAKSEFFETQEPLTYSIPFAGLLAGIGKNASYAAARRGEIPTIKLGGKHRVPGAKWRRMLAEGLDSNDGK